MCVYCNTKYYQELKKKIIDYIIMINTPSFCRKDIDHLVTKSEFFRLKSAGFFKKSKLDTTNNTIYWHIPDEYLYEFEVKHTVEKVKR